MTCTPVQFAGASGIVCSRTRTRRCRCGKPATKLCDFPVTRRGRAATCDKALCEDCAQPIDADRDYCPPHDRHARSLAERGEPVVLQPCQTDLFTHPRARKTDPESSHEAADRNERSGRRALQQTMVEDLVWKHPGLTTKELARVTGVDRALLGRRMPEIEEQGRIHRTKAPGEEMRCWPGPKIEGATL